MACQGTRGLPAPHPEECGIEPLTRMPRPSGWGLLDPPSPDGRLPPSPTAAAEPPDEDEAGDEAAHVGPHGDPFRDPAGGAERGHAVEQLEQEPEDDEE